jgi:hypothetical protein
MSTSPEHPNGMPEPPEAAAALPDDGASSSEISDNTASESRRAEVSPAESLPNGYDGDASVAGDHLDREPGIPVIPSHVNKEIFSAALRATLVMLIVLTIVGVGIGAVVAGTTGVWGALLGVAVALLFSGSTILSMVYTADKSPNATMAVLLGVWVAKMIVLIVVLAMLGQLDFYHHVMFAVIVLVGVIGSAGLDMYTVVKGREPYITPQ